MKDYTKLNAQTDSRSATGFDAGLRSYMLKVYNYMGFALAITGLVAFFTANSQVMVETIFANQAVFWLVALAPLGLVLWLSFGIHKMSVQTAQFAFWGYSILMGL